MYVPVVDPSKRAQLEEIKERTHHSKVKKSSRTGSVEANREIASETDVSSASKSWKPRKFKPNSLVPPTAPPREAVRVDYLGERRRERDGKEVGMSKSLKNIDLESELQGTDLTDKEAHARLIHKTKQIERAAKLHELHLNSRQKTTHIEDLESVNDALVSSVKAKLALLDSVSRK
jgi:hypothetical protein